MPGLKIIVEYSMSSTFILLHCVEQYTETLAIYRKLILTNLSIMQLTNYENLNQLNFELYHFCVIYVWPNEIHLLLPSQACSIYMIKELEQRLVGSESE